MKKSNRLLPYGILLIGPVSLFCNPSSKQFYSIFDLSVSTGHVWKSDPHFRQVYGNGIQDIITLDARYWFMRNLGIGLQSSYWLAHGKTTVLKRHTRLWEIPLTLNIEGRVGHKVQFYGALGSGVIFVNEKSYLGTVGRQAWCVLGEMGVDAYFIHHFYFTGAFQYLYSRKKIESTHETADFGGFGLRGGLGYSF